MKSGHALSAALVAFAFAATTLDGTQDTATAVEAAEPEVLTVGDFQVRVEADGGPVAIVRFANPGADVRTLAGELQLQETPTTDPSGWPSRVMTRLPEVIQVHAIDRAVLPGESCTIEFPLPRPLRRWQNRLVAPYTLVWRPGSGWRIMLAALEAPVEEE